MILLLVCTALVFPQTVLAAERLLDIESKSAIVIEASTGKVLYAKNANDRHYPASTTKMMTLIVALENGNLEDTVTVSAHAASTEGSSLELTAGEQLSLLNMLCGMMLISGNDATVAVAEHITGSVDKFAEMMTAKAHDIGANNTNFVNSSGLPDSNHYSTAADLAKIAAYGYKNPIFAKIVGIRHALIHSIGKDHDRDLYNENKLLVQYKGGNGVKTGYTEVAGQCLVSGAVRNGVQLVAVVLDSERMWDDSIRLLDFGFSQIKPEKLLSRGDVMGTVGVNGGKVDVIPLELASDIIVPVSDDDNDSFSTVVVAPNRVEAPVVVGQKVGEVKIYYKNKEFASVDLVAAEPAEEVKKKSFLGPIVGKIWGFLIYVVKNFA